MILRSADKYKSLKIKCDINTGKCYRKRSWRKGIKTILLKSLITEGWLCQILGLHPVQVIPSIQQRGDNRVMKIV